MCKNAGLVGTFTNHSLRATAVSRMYELGLTEKAIMKRSGNRSVEGVRSYQREEVDGELKVSNALSSSAGVVRATTEKSSIGNREIEINGSITEEDMLLVNACVDYERTLSQITVGGILQGANVHTLNININMNK